jgi:nucleoside-diphosphate-sugar epimerase
MARTQFDLVERLVDAVRVLPWRPRLVQLGTVHEYGAVAYGSRATEDHSVAPVTPYGRIKAAASRVVLDAAGAGAIDGVVLRVSNAVGPGIARGSLFGTVAAELLEAARTGPRRLELRPMVAERDFVDVRDVGDALLRSATAPVTGRVLNIGSGKAARVRALVHDLVAIGGAPLHVVERAADGAEATPRAGGSEWTELDTTLARELLGWRAAHTAQDALRALWASVADIAPREATG